MRDNKKRPILSIVIANYNYGRFLDEAIRSIVTQEGFDRCELIVCDAASTDNSVEIIKKYEDQISWWCSEKDNGQSDAFNKGFLRAKGEFITWLNADEVYVDGTFRALFKHIQLHPEVDWITSNDYAFSDRTNKIVYICWGPHWSPFFLKRQHASSVAFGPSAFIRKVAYEKVGLFDVDIHYGMDFAYWHRMTKAGYRQSRMNRFTWGFRTHAESKTSGVQTEKIKLRQAWERKYAIEKYGLPFRHSYKNFWYCLWMICRIMDGSLFLNLFYRLWLKGRDHRSVFKIGGSL